MSFIVFFLMIYLTGVIGSFILVGILYKDFRKEQKKIKIVQAQREIKIGCIMQSRGEKH